MSVEFNAIKMKLTFAYLFSFSLIILSYIINKHLHLKKKIPWVFESDNLKAMDLGYGSPDK